ncbi:unnamed protein product, partial [Vitis vinifera]
MLHVPLTLEQHLADVLISVVMRKPVEARLLVGHCRAHQVVVLNGGNGDVKRHRDHVLLAGHLLAGSGNEWTPATMPTTAAMSSTEEKTSKKSFLFLLEMEVCLPESDIPVKNCFTLGICGILWRMVSPRESPRGGSSFVYIPFIISTHF